MEQPKNAYEIAFERATNEKTREEFWREQASLVDWVKKPDKILDKSNPNKGFWRWYPDSKLNMCYNCVDRHLDIPDFPAINWYSSMVNKEITYTYKQLHEKVAKLASVYKNLGVKKGDRVIVYMPMIPEAIFAMLASCRIGAIHSVVFGGFAAKELAGRIEDCQPTLIATATCGFEPKKVIQYKTVVDEAIKIAKLSCKVLIVQRPELVVTNLAKDKEFDYEELMKTAKMAECEPVEGTHPLYILYTSGTTGQPKGIVRDTAGAAVAISYNMKHINDINKKDSYFSGADIGWVVGHHFTVYGPLIRGASTLVYEGKPTLPNPGMFWFLIEKYKVKGLYTAPTALRAIRKEDPSGEWMKKYHMDKLTNVSMAGERCDVPTYNWILNGLNVLINDNYWQTEAGWIISCNYKNLHTFKPKPGSAVKPAPGFDLHIMDQDNKPIAKSNTLGKICLKLPMPPSFMLTLWGNDEAFIKRYLTEVPGYYLAGDCGYFDDDGYLNVMTRIDDIINTAGHRLSTAQMEEVLCLIPDIIEAAVVSKIDDLKGEIPVGFIVPNNKCTLSKQDLVKAAILKIRQEIGPVASFQICFVVNKLPKTRSGKILRFCLRHLVNGEKIDKMPATIEDASALTVVEEELSNSKLELINHLQYVDAVDKIDTSIINELTVTEGQDKKNQDKLKEENAKK